MCAERIPLPGAPHPLGATHDPRRAGTNFAVRSPSAESVTLCLFDDAGAEVERLALTQRDADVWHGFVAGPAPGERYGFRVAGPWDPTRGHRFNPDKLLLDPYARAITGDWSGDPATFGHTHGGSDLVRDTRDSAPHVPHSVIVGTDAYRDDVGRPPARALADTVIYELHVRGFTHAHPELPPELRGTYAGLGHRAVTEYLTGLGVTAVELLPVHQFVSEEHLLVRNLRNYWGYNTIGWFAPHAGYSGSGSTGGQVSEFRAMVRALHAAGLEVILDVVYNHTAEGDEIGPTFCYRGLDNRGWYRLRLPDGRRYDDTTGCGNTVDARSPQVLTLIADSLRYWATEMGVDGFRFDLTPALLRGDTRPDLRAALLEVLGQDPVLSQVKLIAEPWDLGEGGYVLGGFPPPWTEWNDRFRGELRDFWRRAGNGIDDVASRLAGSSDLFNHAGRTPEASVNFVTAHDGFTLHDLVTYTAKHNAANGEDNRDGTDDNRSWNCGVEGETEDPAVLTLRERQIRNLLLCLVLAAGVPMLVAGDERGRTQRGNNNGYCLDDPTTWVDWTPGRTAERLTNFTRALLALRAAHPVFRSRRFFTGVANTTAGLPDLGWYASDGLPLAQADWCNREVRTIGMLLNGAAVTRCGPDGERLGDDSFLVVLHAGAEPVEFRLPELPTPAQFHPVLATTDEAGRRVKRTPLPAGSPLPMLPNSAAVLRIVPDAN
ncbi:MAG TPA: glycogen debranching protein GlgX [Sporichthyaceae bacterium]|nr:glycogen debranching protein GlgX [Sporichthyaceae bacterium]